MEHCENCNARITKDNPATGACSVCDMPLCGSCYEDTVICAACEVNEEEAEGEDDG